MKLLSYLKIYLPILIIGLCFSSCTKEDIDTTPDPTPTTTIDTETIENIIDKNDLGVFASVSACDCYGPFDDIDWENLTDEEIQAQVEAAIASMTEEELIALFTPVCADGILYANACEAECEGITEYGDCEIDWDEEWDDETDTEWGCDFDNLEFLGCYELQFPATVVFEDGSTIVVEDMDQFLQAIFTSGNESPELAYPITLTNIETGDVEIVNNDEELAGLSLDCFNVPGGPGGPGGPEPNDDCIVDSFPMTLTINGEPFTINNEEEFPSIIEQWQMDNPDATDIIMEVGFPMTLTFDSGDVVTVNNEEEYFNALVEYCP